jgi:hypothetical protein
VFELEHFRDRGAVFLPGADPNPLRAGAPGDDKHRVTGTMALAAAIAHGFTTPDEKLGVTGHAAAPNQKTLSQSRAQNAMLILTANAPKWSADAAASADANDANFVLAWVSARFEIDCDPTRPGAFDRFIPAYNTFTFTGDRSAQNLSSQNVAAGNGDATMWAAFFDFYYEDVAKQLRALEKNPALTSADARAQAAGLQFFADDQPPPPPPKTKKPYLLIRRIDQIFPVKIAEISTGDANQWPQLNPLNPGSLLDPNNPSAGWRNMKPGERIYLPIPPQVPFEWGPALLKAGYDIRDENDPDSDPQFDTNGRPLGFEHLTIRSTDSVWPVKLAQEAFGDPQAGRYVELNPVNPHLMRGNNQWKDLYANDVINLPTKEWADALRGRYQIDPDPLPQKKQPPPAQSPTQRATGCQSHHLDAPFASGQPRRAVTRRAEALFVTKRNEPLRICESDDPACSTDSCDFYDPLEFEFTYEPTVPLPLPLPLLAVSSIERVRRDGEAQPNPRVCEPFRVRAVPAAIGPLPTPEDLESVIWTLTIDGVLQPTPPTGDKLRFDRAPDEWFGKVVTLSAHFPSETQPLLFATASFNFERSEATEYIALVRKVEQQQPTWDAARVAGALRRLAGYDTDLFQYLYGTIGRPADDLAPDGVALSQADIDRLKALSAYAVNNSVETGLAHDDPTGTPVAMGHVICGVSAGLARNQKLQITIVAAATPLAFLRGRASSLPLLLDNLYAATLAGDLGQSASQVFDKKLAKRVGADSAATDAELTGDIDGFLIGLSMKPGNTLSVALSSYYCVRGNSPMGASQRFRSIAAQTPDLDDQTQRFCALFWMRKHGTAMGAVRHLPAYPLERLGFEVKPTLDEYRKLLESKKPDELKRSQLADAADQLDAQQGFFDQNVGATNAAK